MCVASDLTAFNHYKPHHDSLPCLQADPENANVYIGNLAAEVTDLELRQHVGQFGIVLDVKIYRKGGYAFAQVRSLDVHCDVDVSELRQVQEQYKI